MIEVTAMRGDDHLGFLAALGVLSLAEQGLIPRVRLGWSAHASPRARFATSGLSTVDDLADAVTEAFERIVAAGAVIPNAPAEFPLKKHGTAGPDPMRMPPKDAARWYEEAAQSWSRGDRWFGRWVLALLAQATVNRQKDREEVRLSPFYAPTGQMSMRTSMFEKTIEAVRRVEGPRDAFYAWRRLVGYDGANLDERAKRDAAVSTSGEPENAGAPSPTWLAMMALPFFPIADGWSELAAVGWQRVRLYPGYTRRSLVWPIWEDPTDGSGVRALLERPELEVQETSSGHRLVRPGGLDGLGVFAVFGASRITLSQGDGPIGRTVQLWGR